MDNVRLTFLFYRYVNDICSERERRELLHLLADADNEEQVKILTEELWNEVSAGNLSVEQSQRIFQKILSKDKTRFLSNPIPWTKIAASLAIIILGAAGLVYFRDSLPNSHAVHHETSNNAIASFIKLQDGSTVVLNAGSKLEYPDSFSENVREVYLEGEGYFDVAHDPSREFVVHTGKLRTTVLGTAFNIQAYAHQKNITVTVRRGKVQVSDDKKIFGILNSNQQITFDRDQHYAKQMTVDSDQVTSWIEKDIFFDDITLGEAIDQLEKRFDIPIHFANSRIENCRFTATFVKGEDLEQILRILCEFNDATLLENAPGFVIEGGACAL